MKSISHFVRRVILGSVIFLNTILIAINLFYVRDTLAAFNNFLTACVCWIGIHFVNMSEHFELSNREKDSGEEHDDE